MIDWNLGGPRVAGSPVSVSDSAGTAVRLDRVIAACTRPFVLINERELSVLRRGLTKEGWKRSLYLEEAPRHHWTHVGAGVLSVANRWLEKDVVIPERSGHYHDFFCDCGSRLGIPDDLTVQSEYECPACGKKWSGEKYDGAIRYLQHNHLAGAALSLALVYAIEKDRPYAEKAAEILTKYAGAYPGPHTTTSAGGMLHQSLCEAVWAIPLAQAYDLIYYSRTLSDSERDAVEQRLLAPIAEGLRSVGTEGNWGSWHLSAVGVLGLAVKNTDLVEFALEAFMRQIDEQLGDDGLWPESVHTYHFYPLTAFIHLAEACHRAGIDIYNWEARPGKSLKSMFLAPLQYMYPSFRLPAINDGWYDSFLPLDLYEIAHRRWEDPAFAWALKRGYKFGEAPVNQDQREHLDQFSRSGFYAFLFGRDLPGRSGGVAFKSQNFDNLGISVLRGDDGLMATLDTGRFLSHGHLDRLSFTLYANDVALASDYGTPGYSSKLLEWSASTAAHNTVVVDGKSQAASCEPGVVTSYVGNCMQYVEAAASDCYAGVKHTRGMLVLGNMCIVRDSLASEEEHDYDWLVRCEGVPRVVGEYAPSDADLAAYPLATREHGYLAPKEFRLNWECENGGLALGMWNYSGASDVVLGTCPAETANRGVSLLACRQRAREARFLAAMVATKPGDEVELTMDGSVLKAEGGGWAEYVYLRENDCGEPSDLIETDGEVAAVRTRGGEPFAVVLMRGSYLKWMGETLIECPDVAECVEISFESRSPVLRYSGEAAGIIKLKTNARAMRINGHRANATSAEGHALLRVTPQMLIADMTALRF